MDIKAICFDLDGVYFTPESFKRFRSELAKFTSEAKAVEVLNTSQEMQNFKKGLLSETEYWEYARKELLLPYSNNEIFELLRNVYEVNPVITTTIKKAKDNGYLTCICSNNFTTRIRELNTKFNFLENFDIQIFSYDAHELKPNTRIFELLIAATKVLPEQIIYSDDSEEKLVGATKLGVQTFVFENSGQFLRKLSNYGVRL